MGNEVIYGSGSGGNQKSISEKDGLTGGVFFGSGGELCGDSWQQRQWKIYSALYLAGVRKADGGSFYMRDEENPAHSAGVVDLLHCRKALSKALGYVPQGDPLMEELNAWDNLRMWHDRETLKQSLAGGALRMLGIGEFLKTPVRRMSGGMKKRLSIGCAVVSDPAILLLDEPSAALDPVCKENIRAYLAAYKKSGGIILMVTHDAQDLELCDACYILKDGVLQTYDYDGDFHRLAGALL